jgi:CheY-like chemotaxis protein
MDVQMPVMDGLEATRAIRGEPQLTTLPVIALSAGVMAEERRQALDAGVNDFLPKPMDLDGWPEMILKYCVPLLAVAAASAQRMGRDALAVWPTDLAPEDPRGRHWASGSSINEKSRTMRRSFRSSLSLHWQAPGA